MLLNLPACINEHDIDAAELTPSVATTLIRSRSAVPKLRLLLTIGEMLTPHIIQEFGGSDHNESILYAMYGPTEAAIHCTISPEMSSKESSTNIGRPLDTVTAFVLDSNNSEEARVLPFGHIGELAIAGQLASGYLNLPELTAEVFINLPHYGLVYRTGDLASMNSDGRIDIHGRIKTGQVKLRGQRVELGEVEATVLRLEQIHLAVAMIIHDMLILFCAAETIVEKSTIEQQCADWLPPYMRPNDIIVTNGTFPLLSSGKVDRKSLLSSYDNHLEEHRQDTLDNNLPAGVLPLLTAIQKVLKLEISLHTSFRTIGLDSLRAIELVSNLRRDRPLLSIAMVISSDSVYSLAKNLDNARARMSFRTEANLLHRTLSSEQYAASLSNDNRKCYTCSSRQVALLSETIHNSEVNINSIELQLDESISFETFKSALQMIADQNEILKASFSTTEHVKYPFVWFVNTTANFDQQCSLESPLQIRYEAASNKVELIMHHAIYDGWSLDLIMHDLNSILKGNGAVSRPSFYDFARDYEVQFQLHNDDDLLLWTSNLKSAEYPSFPELTSQVKPQSTFRRMQQRSFLRVTYEELNEAAVGLETSKPALCHTALSILLSELIGQDDIIIGTVFAGRDYTSNCTEVVGPCFSMLPLPLRVNSKSRVRNLIKATTEAYFQCVSHPHITLSQLRKSLGLPPGQQLFEVVFVWQESLNPSQPDDLVRVLTSCDQLRHTLLVEIEPQGADLQLILTYDSSKIAPEQAKCIAAQLDFILQEILISLSARVSDLWASLPPSLDSSSLAIPQTVPIFDFYKTLRNFATDYPQRVALEVVNDFCLTSNSLRLSTLTYAELFTKASDLAETCTQHYDLQSNDLVVIISHKCTDLYVLLAALMMTGIGYLCLDVATPPARINGILCEIKPRLVLVSSSSTDLHLGDGNVAFDTLEHLIRHSGEIHKLDKCFHPQISNEALAYAISTSGSTGAPKVVSLSRANLATNLAHLTKIYPHASSSRVLQSSSLGFDLSVFEIFWTWHCGMTLCAVDKTALFLDIESLVRKLEVTHLSMTPSVAALLDPANVPSVQVLVCAGEPMSAKVFHKWAGHG